jgi:hypothetical protein
MQFNVYYRSQENGEYVRGLIESSEPGCVAQFKDLTDLPGVIETDVILLEYQENDPHLDRWIARVKAHSRCPEIFFFVEAVSPRVIWQALKLGVREVFTCTMALADFQEAVVRLERRRTMLEGTDPDINAGRVPTGPENRLGELACSAKMFELLRQINKPSGPVSMCYGF